ncbi:MAG: protein-methionine-sulfoxide reductase catalytic subunit MsrP [Acidobacteriota bacterium]
MRVRRKKPWGLLDRDVTPEGLVVDRRRFLETIAFAGVGAAFSAMSGCDRAIAGGAEAVPRDIARLYPAKRNARYAIDRPISKPEIVESYNNYYEFGDTKDSPAHASQKLTTRPWVIEIAGLVQKPFSIDRDDLVRRMRVEERVYRHRCVEAWSIAVPWTGFPLKALVDLARPLSSARFLRTVSFKRPSEAPDQLKPWYPFPYFEGFRLDEAVHELAFVSIGSYGRELPKQNGLPMSLRMPWKYGYKSPKAIARFEFTDREPPTFWRSLAPFEYGFLSNVNPAVPHPRWSQATEKFFGPNGIERRPTLPYNGYADSVARLYDDQSRRLLS